MNSDTDNSDTQDEPYISKVPPITNNHILLPLPGGRYAPRTLTAKGHEYELTHFLEVYNHLCAHHKITCSREKCRGIVHYCCPKIVRMIKRFPSYITGDFNQLVKDLYYFLDDEDNTYDAGKVESFTKKWRNRKIESMKQFKHYHRKYLELVGQAIGSQNMTDRDFNRYFWEGIHHSLRRKIEDRMLIAKPELDVSTPFEMSQVVKAVGSLFNQHRFDQHLFGKPSHDFSDSEPDEESYKCRRPQSDSDDEKDSESDDSDYSRTSLSKKKRRVTDQKTSSTTDPHPKSDSYPQKNSDSKEIEGRDISHLTQKIHQANLTDPEYRAFYTDIIREVLDEQRQPPTITNPMTSQSHFQRNAQSHQNTPYSRTYTQPYQDVPYPRTYIPPHQDVPYSRTYTPSNQDIPYSRTYTPSNQDIPSSRRYTPPQGQFPQTSDAFCHGCGLTGHRIAQCGEINALINQRVIIRNSWGKLQWPDGSPIYKDRDELWVSAIEKAIKRTNLVEARTHNPVNKGAQQYNRVAPGHDNASHKEQIELSCHARQTRDNHTGEIERNPRFSGDTRKQVQFSMASSVQEPRSTFQHKSVADPDRHRTLINQEVDYNHDQPTTPKRIRLPDVHQDRFKAGPDFQSLPTEVDQRVVGRCGNEVRRIPIDQRRSEVIRLVNSRTRPGYNSTAVIQDIPKRSFPVTFETSTEISSAKQRYPTSMLRRQQEVSSHMPEIKETVMKIQEATTVIGDKEDDQKTDKIHVLAVRKEVPQLDIPDSEPEQDEPGANNEDRRFNQEPPQQQAAESIPDNRDNNDDGTEDQHQTRHSSSEDEEIRWFSKPPDSHRDTRIVYTRDNSSRTIKSELHDSYIKMVHKGDNETEWNLFCEAEKKQLKQHNNRWKIWKAEKEQAEAQPGTSIADEPPPRKPPEPSVTFTTPEPAQRPISSPTPISTPKQLSITTTISRSKRVHGDESQKWPNQKRRMYEREEKQMRKCTTNQDHRTSDPTLASYGLKLSILLPEKRGQTEVSNAHLDTAEIPKNPQQTHIKDAPVFVRGSYNHLSPRKSRNPPDRDK